MSRLLTIFFIVIVLAVSAASQAKRDPDFFEFIATKTAANKLDSLCPIQQSAAARRILAEYGAIFSAADVITQPPTCMFDDAGSVADFQKKLPTGFIVAGGLPLTFQKAAAESLAAVLEEAKAEGIRIRPLDGEIAAGRNFDDTLRLWNSRFQPALRFWVSRGKISPADAEQIQTLTLNERVERVMIWEDEGLFFGTGRAGTIFSSVAPPGASQHLSLVAFDVAPPITPSLRAIMNSHGWFQTVKGDVPHFTYLGVAERELPGRGLKAVIYKGTQYWVPNVSPRDDTTLPPDRPGPDSPFQTVEERQ